MIKKLAIVLVIVAAAAGAYVYLSGDRDSSIIAGSRPQKSSSVNAPGSLGTRGDLPSGKISASHGGGITPSQAGGERNEEEEESEDFDLDVSAVDKYRNADEALAAIKKGAVDYDDFVLQQFVEPGEACTWCDSLYNTLRNMIKDPSFDMDERGYFAELLAISGRVDNIAALVDGIQNPQSEDEQDMLAESLELAIGGDKMLNYLAGLMDSKNEVLQESVIAAISNQGSRLAAELLYKNAVDMGDSNGWYDLGIGLGELVPEDETLPYLQELVLKRDEYSHLAVKALLNSGLPGLTMVFDTLSNPKPGDSKLLEDASDHIIYDEEIKAYLEKMRDVSNVELIRNFSKQVLEEFEDEEEDLLDEEDEDTE